MGNTPNHQLWKADQQFARVRVCVPARSSSSSKEQICAVDFGQTFRHPPGHPFGSGSWQLSSGSWQLRSGSLPAFQTLAAGRSLHCRLLLPPKSALQTFAAGRFPAAAGRFLHCRLFLKCCVFTCFQKKSAMQTSAGSFQVAAGSFPGTCRS